MAPPEGILDSTITMSSIVFDQLKNKCMSPSFLNVFNARANTLTEGSTDRLMARNLGLLALKVFDTAEVNTGSVELNYADFMKIYTFGRAIDEVSQPLPTGAQLTSQLCFGSGSKIKIAQRGSQPFRELNPDELTYSEHMSDAFLNTINCSDSKYLSCKKGENDKLQFVPEKHSILRSLYNLTTDSPYLSIGTVLLAVAGLVLGLTFLGPLGLIIPAAILVAGGAITAQLEERRAMQMHELAESGDMEQLSEKMQLHKHPLQMTAEMLRNRDGVKPEISDELDRIASNCEKVGQVRVGMGEFQYPKLRQLEDQIRLSSGSCTSQSSIQKTSSSTTTVRGRPGNPNNSGPEPQR